MFLSYIYLSSEVVVVGEQPRALFGSLLSIAVSLRCVLSGEMLSRVTLPFVLSLSTAQAFCFFRCWAARGDKQEANKRNLDIVSFDGSTFLWLEQIELTFFWCAFWLINSSGASSVELFKCFASWIVHEWSEQGHFVGRMFS